MAGIISIRMGDREVKAIERDFEVSKEEWNVYKLLDGGTVRIKTSAMKIFQVVDEDGSPQYTSEGDLLMVVRHKSDIVVRA